MDMNKGDYEDYSDPEALASPWLLPFDQLRPLMVPIGEHLFKRITRPGQLERELVPDRARVSVRFSAFWEGEGSPFDSSLMRSDGAKFEFDTGRAIDLEGLETAVRTMHPYEQAEFIVSRKLLTRGAKGDGLFKVEVIDYTMIVDEMPKEERNKFSVVYPKAKEMHAQGKRYAKQSRYHGAVGAFERARDTLAYCRPANDEEKRLQTALLLKLCLGLLTCFNKLDRARRVCVVMKDVRRLTANNPPCKALFHEARALSALGEHVRAREILMLAHRKEPENQNINDEIVLVDERIAKYEKAQRDLWSRAPQPEEPIRNPVEEAKETKFKQDIEEMIKGFENSKVSSMELPVRMYSYPQLEVVYDVIKEHNINFAVSPTDVELITLSKKDCESPNTQGPDDSNIEGQED